MREVTGFVLLVVLVGGVPAAVAEDRTIVYQGQLKQNGVPITGTVDLGFGLYESSDSISEVEQSTVLGVEVRAWKNGTFEVPFFRLDGEKVWGATAMVLSEFLCMLGSPPDPWRR